MEEGFEKGCSINLPKIDGFMVAQYYAKNCDYVAAEMRGVKMNKSARDSYGDNAIGYVQIKRTGDICVVKCRITPEHRVRTKPYHCTLKCNEKDEEVVNISCEDCAASKGGCKHAVAFLMWLHRRSEEPSTTDVKCYWKKSKLSGIGTTQKMIKVKDFGSSREDIQPNPAFFEKLAPKVRDLQIQCPLTRYITERPEAEKISLHHLIHTFTQSSSDLDVDTFIAFCKNEMIESRCLQVKEISIAQADSDMWFQMRYGRITASKMHEAAQCQTSDGSLVEVIFGASHKFKESAAIKRGKLLENDVRKQVSHLKNAQIEQCGLILDKKWPMFGSSPDGLTCDHVVEIKCPFKEKTVDSYCKNGILGKKYYAQVQAQMHMSGKNKGFFCVAHVDFETTKNVDVYEVLHDEKYCEKLFSRCEVFWKNCIYDKLIDINKNK